MLRKALMLDAAFEGGRMFAGATSTAYLLLSGLSMSDVALLKMIQAIIVLVGEVPTGVIADIYGSRKSLLLSTLAGAIGFSIYFVGGRFWVFIAAEICIAICLCFWSGAYEAYALDSVGVAKNEAELNRFFHLNSSINSLSVVICGFVGGIIANQSMANAFLPCIFIMLFICFYLYTGDKSLSNKNIGLIKDKQGLLQSLKRQLEVTLQGVLLNSKFITYILAVILFNSLMVPIVYYWQPWFIGLSNNNYGFSLGTIFATFNSVIFISSLLAARLLQNSIFKQFILATLSFFGLGIALLVFAKTRDFYTAWILFCILEAFYKIGASCLNATINRQIEPNNRASVLSCISLLSRIGAFASLGVMGFFLKISESQAAGLKIIFSISALLAIFLGLVSLTWIRFSKRQDSVSHS